MAFLPRLAAWLALGGIAAAASAQPLPPEIEAALARAKLPRDAVTLAVADAEGRLPPRLWHRTDTPVNPASIAKLATTFAALELLGPAWTWTTPVYVDGPVQAGTLQGNLYLKGQGDPRLVMERLWLLLRRVQGLGVRRIAGDIVIDRSAFEVAAQDPGAFDGEPLRPYNAAPDALLVNFRAMVLQFTPQGNVALLQIEPPMAGLQAPASVPLQSGECNDWRGALRADFRDPTRLRFDGAFPSACGPRSWPVAAADPANQAGRAIAGMWQEMGGQLTGKVREGRVPTQLKPVAESVSPTLTEVVRDVNKFSNNVMAQQLFLTLSLQQRGVGTIAGSRAVLQQWWRDRLRSEPPVFDNGSGLSRDERATAAQLTRLLQHAWTSPLMPEFVASLPVAGLDGTAKRTAARTAGVAHLKTGSLRDVTGVAGYVHAPSGRRYAVVAIANHANAGAMRGVIDTLVEWTAREP
jgi:D-alanyl-D-alanine carboxypeptidase/D-alanyl-D-alanine-endopeptidase (penicillin-binding protein 4)